MSTYLQVVTISNVKSTNIEMTALQTDVLFIYKKYMQDKGTEFPTPEFRNVLFICKKYMQDKRTEFPSPEFRNKHFIT